MTETIVTGLAFGAAIGIGHTIVTSIHAEIMLHVTTQRTKRKLRAQLEEADRYNSRIMQEYLATKMPVREA